MARNLYLLDGMALAYRAHFALIKNPITTSRGFNTSALYGFTATLIELLTNRRPSHIAVAFDTSAPTERHRLHPEYKATREEMPEDLSAALPHLDRIARAFAIPVLRKDGYEADDIIGTLARKADAEGFGEIFLVTPDKDFGQLVNERIRMYRPSRQGDGAEILDPEAVKAKWNVTRIDQVIDMLGLCGDTADNIPGIPGIGPKTAAKLLAQYETVENLLEHVDELKGKQQQRVRENAEQALLSKKLATIQTDVPVEADWEELRFREPDKERIAPVFDEFEFRTLGKRLFGNEFSIRTEAPDLVLHGGDDDTGSAAAPEGDESADERSAAPARQTLADSTADYRTADSPESRQALLQTLRASGTFAFDTETDHLNPRQARLVGLSFATSPQTGWFVPIPADEQEAEKRLAEFRPIFETSDLPKIGHNLKFDLSVLARHGIHVRGACYDSMLAHSLLDPDQRHGLDTLAETHLNYRPIPFHDLFPKAKKGARIDYSTLDPKALADYAIEDADITLRLWRHFRDQLEAAGQSKVFYEIETPLLPVLAAMENEGIRVDRAALAETGRLLDEQILALREAVHRAAGREFNLNSPQQLGKVLFEDLKLAEKPKKTRTGQYATNEQTLAALAPKHPIIGQLLEYRQLAKLKSTYVNALPEAIDPGTGRVHTHYGQIQTATGRLSSNDPNLQNIPVRSERGREIRKAFVPREGWKLLAADYSQIELRVLAALTGDAGLLQAFRDGRDIHTATAGKIFHCGPDEVTREQRGTAKMVNFGIPYGISAFGLAQRLGTVSRAEAETIIRNYFEQFPGIPRYMETVKENARKHGYVETITGRRRRTPDINSANATVRSAAERNAINMPIQGTAADMIKIAMVRINHAITRRGLESRMILQVHDELLFDLRPGEEEELRQLVTEGMTHALDLDCPIEIETGTGANWLEAH